MTQHPEVKEEVERQASDLRKFWRAQGFSIATKVVQCGEMFGRPIWQINSDMLNGLPRKH